MVGQVHRCTAVRQVGIGEAGASVHSSEAGGQRWGRGAAVGKLRFRGVFREK